MSILSPTNFSCILPLKENYLNLCETGSRLLELRVAEVAIRVFFLHSQALSLGTLAGVFLVVYLPYIPFISAALAVSGGIGLGVLLFQKLVRWTHMIDIYWQMSLALAVQRGHVGAVRELLQSLPSERVAVDLNRVEAWGQFQTAVDLGHEEIANLIFNRASPVLDPNISTPGRDNVLFLAVRDKSEAAMKFLLKRLRPGISPNPVTQQGFCLLHYAFTQKSPEISQLILERMSVDEIVNYRNGIGHHSFLHLAAYQEDESSLLLVLKYWPEGADLSPANEQNQIPLDSVVMNNHLSAARQIFQRLGPDAVRDLIGMQWHWLLFAASEGRTDMIRLLFQYLPDDAASRNPVDDDGKTLYNLATENRHLDTAELFLPYQSFSSSRRNPDRQWRV